MLSSSEREAQRRQHARWSEQAQQLFETQPGLYWLFLVGLIACGYLLLSLVVMAPVAVLAGLVVVGIAKPMLFLVLKKAVFFLLAFVYWLFKSLWVKAEIPDGFQLTRQQYPALFAELTTLRKQLRIPTIHQVLLDDSYNAAVVQTPRFGLLGWYHNTLLVGLPLLLTLTPEQARAVLAHELGHLSRNHGVFANWVYRLRLRWWRVLMVLHNASEGGARSMANLIERFVSFFSAYTLVYARRCEFDADAVSARLTSPAHAASALVATHVGASWLDESFWQPAFRRADIDAQPAADIYQQLHEFTRQQQVPDALVQKSLRQLSRRQTAAFDSHPPTLERVKALGQDSLWQAPAQQAAELWLAGNFVPVLEHFSLQWQRYYAQDWHAHHQSLQVERERLATLRQRDVAGLIREEQWDLLRLTARFEPETDAIAPLEAFLAQYPDDLPASVALGIRLLESQDSRGIRFMLKAHNAFEWRAAACQQLHQYFVEVGDDSQAAIWLRRSEAHADELQRAEAERRTVRKSDQVVSGQFDAATLQQMHYQLLQVPAIKRAWVARKELNYPGKPIYIIAIEAGGLFTGQSTINDAVAAAARQLKLDLEFFVVATKGSASAVAHNVKTVGQAIYPT